MQSAFQVKLIFSTSLAIEGVPTFLMHYSL